MEVGGNRVSGKGINLKLYPESDMFRYIVTN